jgi:hypothetical protein
MSSGRIEPTIYFRCYSSEKSNPQRPVGYLLIAPYTECPTPSGYERCEALYLNDVYKLEKVLVQQERDGWEQEAELEEERFAERRAAVRDKLYARMTSSATSEYEREFISEWLKLRDDKKRAKYAQFYTERQAYLHALHFDTPSGRRVDEEKFSIDRIGPR